MTGCSVEKGHQATIEVRFTPAPPLLNPALPRKGTTTRKRNLKKISMENGLRPISCVSASACALPWWPILKGSRLGSASADAATLRQPPKKGYDSAGLGPSAPCGAQAAPITAAPPPCKVARFGSRLPLFFYKCVALSPKLPAYTPTRAGWRGRNKGGIVGYTKYPFIG